MNIGDLVKTTAAYSCSLDRFENPRSAGIIIEIKINMWGEDVTPTGVKVMWDDGEIENVYEDEVEIPDENWYSC